MVTIIAGSRDIKDYFLVKRVIEESKFQITEVVSGTAKGVDQLGEQWAKENCIKLTQFEAEWTNIYHPDAVIKNSGKLYCLPFDELFSQTSFGLSVIAISA